MKTVNDVNFGNKKVLIRVDYNVPLNKERQVTDDTRIKESIPTIQKILNDGGSVILMSHLGRPKGGLEVEYSLAPIVPVLSKYLNREVKFKHELINSETIEQCKNLKPGEVLLLENIRFYPEEEAADENFAKKLSELGDAYVNDAFATSHRAHASTCTIAKFFPNSKYFGLLLANEVKNLNKVLNEAVSPFTAIIGGAKVSTKLDVIRNLLTRVDNLIIGGGMAFTFIKALGGKIGKSIFEEKMLDNAKEIIYTALTRGINLYLPSDALIADNCSDDANTKECDIYLIPDDWMGLDIGKKSIRRFSEVIKNSRTILWNGPMGVFEISKFQEGTKDIAISVAGATLTGAFSLVGGGDSVAAINMYNLANKMSYVSTGGGAMLEYVEGKELPGIKALLD